MFSKTTLLALGAASVSAYSSTERTFAVNHFYGKGPLLESRIDPIVNPGGPSGHVHMIQGGNAFNMTMTDSQPMTSTCTSSRVKNDLSNYWVPKMYFQDPKTGKIEDVELFYMNVYYFFEKTDDKIKAFPPGLRILAGDPFLRSPPATGGRQITDHSDGAIQPVQMTCPRSNANTPLYPANSDGLHGVGIGDPNNKGSGVGFPDKNCDGYASPLRADIHLPSCYNPAKTVDDYKNNMDYPTNGNCPAGWIHVPHMFYEVYWNTPAFVDRWTQGQGKQPFLLANGDVTGYGHHADFVNGWHPETLQQIIDNCDAGDSGMDKCPGLIGGLNDPSTSCNLVSPINEVITGVMDKLPGNNPVGSWGVAAPAPPSSPAPSVSAPAGPSKPTTSAYSANPAPTKPAPTKPATPTKSADPADPPKPVDPTKVVDDPTKPAPVTQQPESTSESSPTVAAPSYTMDTTAVPVPTAVGSSNTLVTSYVSETTVVWTTVTAPGPAPTAASGWSYKGCYADTKDRLLTGIQFANVGQHAVTNEKCTAYCDARGFTIAGTEYGGQCFCDNKIDTAPVAETECDMPCEGDAKQTCGGTMNLSVYSKSASKARRHLHRHAHNHI